MIRTLRLGRWPLGRWPLGRWLGAGALCAAAAGCGGDLATQARLQKLQRQVAELSRKNQEAQGREEELEGRVSSLTEQLESTEGRREVPIVTLRPPPPPEVTPGPAPAPAGQTAPVEFSGPARSDQPDHVRPLLRAEGEGYAESLEQAVRPGPPVGAEAPARAERRARRARAAASPAPVQAAIPAAAAGTDNLGVMPIPRVPPPGGDVPLSGVSLAAAAPGASLAPAPAPVLTAALRPAAPRSAARAEADEAAQLYKVAYESVRAGRFPEAERDLREFVRRFPRHDLADNAQYWLGETFYARKTYTEAAAAFRAVVERWPGGNKAPDALLKLGYSLLQLGETQKGQGVLRQVMQTYPNSPAARLAAQRLGDRKDPS